MNDLSALKAQALAEAQPQLTKLKKATNNLESIFVKNLLTEMQKGTHMFGNGPGAGIYQDLMDQQLSESIGGRGSLGLSSMLYKQLEPRILAQVEAQIRLRGSTAQQGNKNS